MSKCIFVYYLHIHIIVGLISCFKQLSCIYLFIFQKAQTTDVLKPFTVDSSVRKYNYIATPL